MGETDIADLSTQIYVKHERAIRLVNGNLRTQQSRLLDEAKSMIISTPGLSLCSTYDRDDALPCSMYAVFMPSSWENLIDKIPVDQWSPSGNNLMFWIDIFPGRLNVYLQIRGGPLSERQRLYDIAVKHQPPLHAGLLKDSYTRVYDQPVILPEHYESGSIDDLKARLHEWWSQFVAGDLRSIESIYVSNLSSPASSVDSEADEAPGIHTA